MGLTFEQISRSEWADFHHSSPQKSIFSSVEYLEALGSNIAFFLVRNGQEKIAGFPVLSSGKSIEVPSFSVDAGIHYAPFNGLKEHSKSEIRCKINEILAVELFGGYENVAFNNHPSVIDLRAFDWFNYSSKAQNGGYEIIVRYTSYLFLSSNLLEDNYNQARRYELKKAVSSGVVFESAISIEELDRLHELTFNRQGIQRSENEVNALNRIMLKILSTGSGKMYFCRISGQIVSACVWLLGEGVAHYLFGANDPEFRNTGSGTLCLSHSIKDIYEKKGINKFDFVGINSPSRGAYKLSYGGSIVPYFNVRKIKQPDTKNKK
jgi:hypothetical protein